MIHIDDTYIAFRTVMCSVKFFGFTNLTYDSILIFFMQNLKKIKMLKLPDPSLFTDFKIYKWFFFLKYKKQEKNYKKKYSFLCTYFFGIPPG